MSREIIPISPRNLDRAGFERLPTAITRAGEKAAWRFIEFFTANIRNKNTRAAYAQAVREFFSWCEKHGLYDLEHIRPVVIAGYIEQHQGSPPTVKQHLAAIRMLFDWLVIGQIVPVNPAGSVRGPKHVVKRGKTPVLESRPGPRSARFDRHFHDRGAPRSRPPRRYVLYLRPCQCDGGHAG